MTTQYKVTCLDDEQYGGEPGARVDATSKRWARVDDAMAYAATVAASRFPRVVAEYPPVFTPQVHQQCEYDGRRCEHVRRENAELIAILTNICDGYRTFRNVPEEDQEWTSFDEDALRAGFAALAKAKGAA